MSGWICGTLMLLRVVVVEPDEGRYNTLMESRNVPAQSCSGAVSGEAVISWNAAKGLKEGSRVWARVWARCEPMTRYADGTYSYRAWFCDADRVEVE